MVPIITLNGLKRHYAGNVIIISAVRFCRRDHRRFIPCIYYCCYLQPLATLSVMCRVLAATVLMTIDGQMVLLLFILSGVDELTRRYRTSATPYDARLISNRCRNAVIDVPVN